MHEPPEMCEHGALTILCHNDNVKKIKTLVAKYYRLRSGYYRMSRIIWPSPAEMEFLKIMGGRVITFPFFRHYRTDFRPVIVLSRGKILRRENFRREVRIGSKYADFSNDIKRVIEIDSKAFHDIVSDYEKDEYYRSWGCTVLRVAAVDIYKKPQSVRSEVLSFIRD